MAEKDVLITAARLFPADGEAYERLHGGNFSTVYGYTRAGKSLILRLTPPDSGIDRPDMQSILHWMKYLAENGLNVPAPQYSSQGRLVEEIPAEEGAWLASAVEKAPGVLAERLPFGDWNETRFERLGQAAGKLHALSQRYQPPAGIRPRPRWDESANNNNPIDELPEAEPEILSAREEVLAEVNALPQTNAAFGLIHGDLQCANFFIDPASDTITLFDFDDCCHGWTLMDIALPLLDFLVVYPGLEREAFAARFLSSFLRGYQRENPLDAAWLARLPLFLSLLEIGLYLQVASFAAECAPDSWVGKFMDGRREGILARRPFVNLNLPAVLASTDL